jgi:hypothetical protein
MTANQPLEPMTRSAVTSIFQVERLWRAPRHGSARRSAEMRCALECTRFVMAQLFP